MIAETIAEIAAFSQTSAGKIIIRVICVSAFGAGAGLLVKSIYKKRELGATSKEKVKLELNASLISYSLNIILSIMASFIYSKELPVHERVIEGTFYGLGALLIQHLLETGKLLGFIKIFRKK